jgi:hemerythrin superfamily protein
MNKSSVMGRLSPSITSMIRMDHSHVVVTSHKYTADIPPGRKQAIVETCCRALEIHAQLEEEIFYPALREVDPGNEALEKAVPEHDELRRLIGKLRDAEPGTTNYDGLFYQLIRDVMHHVADEETILLPEAEHLLKERLGELGAQMTKRRLQLVGPHSGEIAVNTARTMPVATMLIAGGVLAGLVYIARRASHRDRNRDRWPLEDWRLAHEDRGEGRHRRRELADIQQGHLIGI